MNPGVTWRSRPVFITSTFEDMHAERDFLREHVFPELEERLRERFHYLDPIDLRLGVTTAGTTDEGARELLVLKVCLGEIDRSRPYLIGLIGDRYGWVPPADRVHAAAREAGFERDLTGRSVTALEIEFGVLGRTHQIPRCRFYLREPLPYDTMPPAAAGKFSEAYSRDAGAADRAERLKGLKTLLRETFPPERVRPYVATWDPTGQRVAGLEPWGRQIVEDLWEDLEAETRAFVEARAVTWQEHEAWLLRQFVATVCREFIGRDRLLRDLVELAVAPGSGTAIGACIVGPPGSGKSALFSELFRRLPPSADLILLAHAAGVSPRAGDVESLLRRWCAELAAALAIADPSVDLAAGDPLAQAFASLLGRAAATRRVVCLIDALNQFERTPQGMHLTWLPEAWPDNMRVIATAMPGTESDALARRSGVEILPLPSLGPLEVDQIADMVARRRRAEIRPELVRLLSDIQRADGERAAGNPLWLELALEEVLLLDADDFARAQREFTGSSSKRLHALRMVVASTLPPDVEGLYAHLLRHSEEVYGERWALEFASLLAAGRAGWRESDLRRLLPARTGDEWSDLRFAALRRGFRAHLVQRGAEGKWDFAHAQMRLAVMRKNLGDDAVVRALHASIANDLASLPPADSVRQTELMYHLLESGNLTAAGRHYAQDLPTIAVGAATRALVFELLEHGDARRWDVSALLTADGLTDEEVGALGHRCVFELHDELNTRASLAQRMTTAEVAQRCLARLVAASPANVSWQGDLSVSHDRIGHVLVAQGNLREALEEFQRGRTIIARLAAADPANVFRQHYWAVSLERIGDMRLAQGNLPGALETFRQSQVIRARLAAADPGHAWQRDLAVSHDRIGDVLVARGNLAGALEAFRQSQVIRVRLAAADPGHAGRQHDLTVSLGRIGSVWVAQGNLLRALETFRESQVIHARLVTTDPGNASWQRDLSLNHELLGGALLAQGNLPGALEEFQRGHAIIVRLASADPANVGWQLDLAVSHSKIGDVRVAQLNLPAAFAAFERGHAIIARLAAADPENAGWQHHLALSHDRIGDVRLAQGILPAALEAFQQGDSIFTRLAAAHPVHAGWQHNLAVSQGRIGDVLVAQENLAGALKAFQQGHSIIARLAAGDPAHAGWQRGLAVSFERIGDVRAARGELRGALKAYRQSLVIRARLATADPASEEGQRDLGVSHLKLGDLHRQQGKAVHAQTHFERCLAILRGMTAQGMRVDTAMAQVVADLERAGIGPSPGESARTRLAGAVDIHSGHPAVDPDRAARQSLECQGNFQAWLALPWWKRFWLKKPDPPTGI